MDSSELLSVLFLYLTLGMLFKDPSEKIGVPFGDSKSSPSKMSFCISVSKTKTQKPHRS